MSTRLKHEGVGGERQDLFSQEQTAGGRRYAQEHDGKKESFEMACSVRSFLAAQALGVAGEVGALPAALQRPLDRALLAQRARRRRWPVRRHGTRGNAGHKQATGEGGGGGGGRGGGDGRRGGHGRRAAGLPPRAGRHAGAGVHQFPELVLQLGQAGVLLADDLRLLQQLLLLVLQLLLLLQLLDAHLLHLAAQRRHGDAVHLHLLLHLGHLGARRRVLGQQRHGGEGGGGARNWRWGGVVGEGEGRGGVGERGGAGLEEKNTTTGVCLCACRVSGRGYRSSW